MSREERFLFRLKHDRPALAHLAQYFIGHVVGRAHRRDADASCHRLIVHRFAVQIRPIGRDDPGGYCRKTGSCTHHARWNGCRSFGLCPRSLGHCQTEGESAAGLSVYRAGRPSAVVSGWRDSISALGDGPERRSASIVEHGQRSTRPRLAGWSGTTQRATRQSCTMPRGTWLTSIHDRRPGTNRLDTPYAHRLPCSTSGASHPSDAEVTMQTSGVAGLKDGDGAQHRRRAGPGSARLS